MPNLIKSKIDLAKIHGAKVLKKDGRIFVEVTDSKLFEGKNGALYLDLAQFETTNDQPRPPRSQRPALTVQRAVASQARHL